MTTPSTPSDTITTPAQCIRCKYTLTGLDLAARCPECGTPCHRSVAPSLLSDADPAYIRALCSGIHRLELALLTIIASGFVALITVALGVIILVALQSAQWNRLPPYFAIAICIGVFGAITLISAIASISRPTDDRAWLPGRIDRAVATRSFIRAILALFTVAVFMLFALGIGWMLLSFNQTHSVLIGLIDACLIATGTLAIMLMLKAADYLREITLRIPDAPLGRRITTAARAAAILVALAVTAFILTNPLAILSNYPELSVTIQSTAWAVFPTMLFASAIPILLLVRHLRRLRRHTTAALASQPAPADDASQ